MRHTISAGSFIRIQIRRIRQHPYFGDLTIMKRLIADVYELTELDPGFIGLYDLYEILKTPAKVEFSFEEERYEVESVPEKEGMVIRFGDTWYRTVDDFFQKAELDGERLTSRYEEVYDFAVAS